MRRFYRSVLVPYPPASSTIISSLHSLVPSPRLSPAPFSPNPACLPHSPIVEVSLLLAEAVRHGLRAIAFCHTRKLCELVASYTRETLRATTPHLVNAVSVYRSGYSASDRRAIESALFEGRLLGVAATNALELGIDVGRLDVTLHLGFPGSVASLWQQVRGCRHVTQRCECSHAAL